MNYSESASNVRVDLFRPTGKWYTVVELDMSGYFNCIPTEGVKAAFYKQYPDKFNGMFAVCLDPFCKDDMTVPIMFLVNPTEDLK